MIANIAYVNLRTPNIHLYRNTLQYFHIRSALTLPSVCPALKKYLCNLLCVIILQGLQACPNPALGLP